MLLSRPKTNSHLLPLLRYRDVGVASEWLCAVFGFQPHFAAKAPDGAVFYAELRLNESMVMLGSAGQYDPNALTSTRITAMPRRLAPRSSSICAATRRADAAIPAAT